MFNYLHTLTPHISLVGHGVDIVDIERFALWHAKSHQQLQKIFSEQEIEYCLKIPKKSAERFAVRFAAKEAFFKALCQAHPYSGFSFLGVCKKLEIVAKNSVPTLWVAWSELGVGDYDVWCSLSHSKTSAFASVIVTKR